MRLISALLNVYMWMIILRVILSWVRPWPRSRAEVLLYQLTEPALGAVRLALEARMHRAHDDPVGKTLVTDRQGREEVRIGRREPVRRIGH